MKLVIVSGPPAVGKTEVAQKIARKLGYEFYSKDAIKESLFNSQSRPTWDYVWYEKKAKKEFFNKIAQCITDDKSLIAESNFIASDKRLLKNYLSESLKIAEIYCTAKGLTYFKRFVNRNEKGIRHKGHHDRRWYITMLSEALLGYIGVRWPYKPLGISSNLLIVDKTNFSEVNYDTVLRFVAKI